MTSILIPPRTEYQYVLELYRDNDEGESEQVATARIRPDWDPAFECARFECARQTHDRALDRTLKLGAEKVSIEPVWSDKLGEPYLKALRAIAINEHGHEAACEIPTAWFQPLAQAASTKVIAEGQLEDGQPFRYLATAYPHTGVAGVERSEPPAGRAGGSQGLEPSHPGKSSPFAIEPVAQCIAVRERNLQEYLRNSRPYGCIDEADLPVFVPESVLDEGHGALEETGAAETGGILIGYMNRDPASNALFLEVTAQIRAKHTQADLTSLTFTPDTWSDVDAAIRLRGENEIQLGWWHTHPARQWCKDCPVENRKVCKRSGEFFSTQDTALHRTVFPRAYSIALVISDSYNDGLTWPVFGWKQGMIQRRGFHVLKE